MLYVILGPTASGKTAYSIKFAEQLKTEIVNADSVQIYKDLKIGSAAPTEEEMQRVKHHLVGIYELDKEINAAEYGKTAADIVSGIVSKYGSAVMCGGTNFYVESFLEGFSPVPEIDDNFQKEFISSQNSRDVSELYDELMQIDPEWALQISSPNDKQRIVRGLTVFHATGKPLSEWNKLPRIGGYKGERIKIALNWDRERLYRRINLRTMKMMAEGLIEETEEILAKGFHYNNCRVLGSIGYKEAIDFLEKRISSEDELIDTIAKNTRHLAKRQLTWLRKYDDVKWIDIE